MTKKNKKHLEDELLREEGKETVETTQPEGQEQNQEASSETEELKKTNEELNEKNLRLMAEFDNYRKRTLKERIELIKTSNEKLLLDMLPLVDDFERAIQATDNSNDIKALKEGLHLIYDKFIAFLGQNGVKCIETENQVFDSEIHEAISSFPTPDEDMKGKIIDCVSKGYSLNEKVIRFPKVVVGE